MAKIPESIYSDPYKNLRIPEPYEGIQVNTCRNLQCKNYGTFPDPLARPRGRPRKGTNVLYDDFKIIGNSEFRKYLNLLCSSCGRTTVIKSNKAIQDEHKRLLKPLQKPVHPSCNTENCQNNGKSIYLRPDLYTLKANLASGRRLACKSCKKQFNVKERSTAGQKKAHENKTVFMEIVSKKSIRGISTMTGLSPEAIYGKIDFLYRQCVGFMGEREAYAHKIEREHSTICVDRQDYMINWRHKTHRKNIQLSAIASVEAESRYVLGHHLNFDMDRDIEEIEEEYLTNGEGSSAFRPFFRKNPQYWTEKELEIFRDPSLEDTRPDLDIEPLSVDDLITLKNKLMQRRPHPEMADAAGRLTSIAKDGCLTHHDYTAYAHALLVRRFMRATKRIDIYTDQDELIRGAFFSAFLARIPFGDVEMAYVQFQKNMTIDEKRALAGASAKAINAKIVGKFMEEFEYISDTMGLEYHNQRISTLDWRERWIQHPRHTTSEPYRKILYLTEDGRKNARDVGKFLAKATLSPVDSYFMQVRRALQYAERPIPSRVNGARLYTGYQPYNPIYLDKTITIYRAYHNYIKQDKNKQTPAMKFGLSKGPIKFEDIIYWRHSELF